MHQAKKKGLHMQPLSLCPKSKKWKSAIRGKGKSFYYIEYSDWKGDHFR